jgi:dTDP-4-dehydrorhamnose 3,5-epimerase-like enzyme|tara:strand:+ start:84 stop:224 length:141 start_codon:yes stop_codon:yes gene_type:complete
MKIYDCFTYYGEDLKIKWKIKNPMISKKDKSLLSFKKEILLKCIMI